MRSGSTAFQTSGEATDGAPAKAGRPADNVRQLRLLQRTKTSIRAVLVCEGQFVPVEIRNISQGGAGLRLNQGVRADDSVALHLPDGRALDGKVRWSRTGFCGVEFSALLPYDDALLGDLAPSQVASAPRQPGVKAGHTSQQSAWGRASTAMSARARRFARVASRAVNWPANAWTVKLIMRRIRRDRAMILAACRKQGFSWLVG